MGIAINALALVAALRLQDELSKPLDAAVDGAKRKIDELSATAQRVDKIKLFDGLAAEVDDLGKKLDEAKRKRDYFLTQAEGGGEAGAKLFARDIRDAKQEVIDLAAQLDAKRVALRDMGEAMREAGVDTDHLGTELAKLETQLARDQGLQQFRQRMAETGGQIQAVGKHIESFGLKVGAIGAAGQIGLRQAGLDLNTLVTGSVKAEDALYGIAITAGQAGDQAKAAVESWNADINRIAVATNKNQAEVVTALQDLIAKGLDPAAAIGMLTPIGKAATAAKADIEDMASAANAAYQNMGVEAGRSLEIMSQAGKAGAFELKDMAGYFDALTVKSKLLGSVGEKSLAELAAAAQIARKGAGDASTAANNLANFLDKLNAPVTAKAFQKFGLNLGEEVKKGLASGDLIGYMGDLVQKVTQGDAAKLSQLFSDVQAKNFIAPLLQNLEEYKRIRDEAFSAKGVVDQDFATAMQSTENKLKAVQIQASAAVNNSAALKDIVATLRDLAAWANEHPELAKWLIFGTAAAVGVGAVAAGIGATVTAIGTLVPALTTVATFVAANPIVLALMGVAVAGGMVWANWDGIVGGAKAAWDDIKNAVGGALDYVAEKYEAWKQAGANLIDSLRAGITEKLKGALGIGEKIMDAVAWLKTQAKEWIAVGGQIVDGIIQGIKAKAQAMWDEVKALGRGAIQAIKDALDIHSPSRQMYLVGEMAGEGLRAGILARVKDVHAAAVKMGEAALYGAKDKLTADWLKATLKDEADLWKEWNAEQARSAEATQRAAESLAKSLRTPFERAAEDMAGYQQLLDSGAISWDTYSRAVMNAMDGIESGSKAAAKAVDAAGKSIDKTFRDSKGRFLPADEAERAAEEWQRAAEDIERSLTDALMRGFENGRGFLDSLVSVIKSTFNTMVLRPVVQAVVAPVAGAAASLFSGSAMASSLGSIGGLSSYTSAGSSGGSALGALSNASTLANLYSMGSNAWTMLGATTNGLFSGATSLGSILGATGANIATAATYGTAIGSAQTAMLAAQEAGMAASTSIASSIGSALSSIPVWGWIAGGILAAFGDKIFGGETKQIASGVDLSVRGADASGNSYAQFKKSGGWFGSSSYWTNYGAIDLTAIDASLSQVANLLTQIGGTDAAARLARYTAAYKGAQSGVEDWIKTVIDGMARTALPKLWDAFRRTGEVVEDTLQRLATTLGEYDAIRAGLDSDIGVLSGTLTVYAAQAAAATTNIGKLTGLLADTTDIQTRIELEGQLHQAVMVRYQQEQQYLASLQQTLAQVATSLAQARSSVAGSALEINPLAVPTAADLRAAIAGATSGLDLPSLAGVLAASDRYGAAQLAEQQVAALAGANASYVAGLQSSISSLYQIASKYGVYLNAKIGPISYNNDAYAYNADTNRLNGYGQITNTNNPSQATSFKSDQQAKDLIAQLRKANVTLAANSKTIASAQAYADSLGTTEQAQAALTAAQQAYADAMMAYAGDATTAIASLETLRSETMRYYQAQDQLAQLMATSAGRLRDEIGRTRASMLGEAGQLADVRAQYDRAYALAASTSGTALAGYADQMAGLLPDLVTSLAGQAATRADWQRAAGRALAQSEAIAARLDAQAPAGYEAESLALLSGIDTALSALESGLRTADQQIVAAIEASKSATVDVLVQIRDNLGAALGTTLPGHADGLARVPYDDYTARLHRDEAVIDAGTMAGLRRYGIPVRGGGGGQDTAALLAELRALREDNANLRAEVRAVVTHTAKTARLMDRAMPDGDALAVRTAA